MNSARRTTCPPLELSSKHLLDDARSVQINSALKELRLCSRSLQSDLLSFKDEFKILERLYYKGKNQHRPALFWKRVVELRRYGRRLAELDLNNLVNTLQCSFFGEKARDNPKLLKGAWTSYPGIQLIRHVLVRLTVASALAEKIRSKLMAAIEFFAISMQSGSFLQLLVVLVAIVSRMNVLASEVQTSIHDGSEVSQRILNILSQGPDYRANSKRQGSNIDMGRTEASTQPWATDPLWLEQSQHFSLNYNVEASSEVSRKNETSVDSSNSLQRLRIKNKARKKKDEIDEIFGF